MLQFPLQTSDSPAFGVVRLFFADAGYDAANLCRVLAVTDMSSVGEVKWDEVARDLLPQPLRLCTELFLRGMKVPAAHVRDVLPVAAFEALDALGMLRASKKVTDALTCPAWVYPVADFVVASDRRDPADDESFAPGNEVVFPAIYGLTTRFLEMLPRSAGGDVIDLCGGTGIGAMLMARTARSAATADLSKRAADYAVFNARLNGIAVESQCGDLYEPAAGRTFDVITAHPPFVPDLGEHVTFRDGGAAGEDIIRGVVAGLPASLRAGGTCMMVCWARDTEQAPFEERVKGWLGDAGPDFDVVFGLEKAKSTEEIVSGMQQFRHSPPEEFRALRERLDRLGTRRFVYGALWIRRRASGEGDVAAPARVGIDKSARAHDIERVLDWRRARRTGGFVDRLLQSRPRLSRHLELVARYGVTDGELAPSSFTFSTDAPLRCGVRVDSWMVPLFARFKGRDSVADVHRASTAAGEPPAGFPVGALAGFVADGVEKGFLEVELAD